MSLNVSIYNGRLPHYEGKFIPATEEKGAFLSWKLSVKREYKAPDEQYYPEDAIPFVINGKQAEFFHNNFKAGDGVILIGKMEYAGDYTDKAGNPVKGLLTLKVKEIKFVEGGKTKSVTVDEESDNIPDLPDDGDMPF